MGSRSKGKFEVVGTIQLTKKDEFGVQVRKIVYKPIRRGVKQGFKKY